MIPKHFRLLLRSEKDFFHSSKKLFLQSMTVFWQESEKTECVVIVPKEVALLAVERNRLKRQVWSALYQKFREISLEQPPKKFAVVVKKHPQFIDIYQQDIEVVFRKLF